MTASGIRLTRADPITQLEGVFICNDSDVVKFIRLLFNLYMRFFFSQICHFISTFKLWYPGNAYACQ